MLLLPCVRRPRAQRVVDSQGDRMLTGKKVVVVGVWSGIGFAIAEMTKAQGAEVVIA